MALQLRNYYEMTTVTLICNPSYLGGRREGLWFKAKRGKKKLVRSYLKERNAMQEVKVGGLWSEADPDKKCKTLSGK
jgi:hypothetical protein